jgi:hypothetical protein
VVRTMLSGTIPERCAKGPTSSPANRP